MEIILKHNGLKSHTSRLRYNVFMSNLVDIRVVGCGGGGINAIDSMITQGLSGVEFIAVNTDVQALMPCLADVKIDIGKERTRGLGAGADVLDHRLCIRTPRFLSQ